MESCLIADDHALVRDALCLSVARRWPTAAVLEADDHRSAWAAAEQQPTVALMDLGMAGSEPLESIVRLQRIAPATHVVIVTAAEDDTLMLALLGEGVAGFVPKSARSAVVIAAIELVLAGGRYLPPRLAELAVAPSQPSMPRQRMPQRQLEVLKLIGGGLSNKEIARALEISPATVKVHIAQAMAAFGAANRTEAAMKARAASAI